MPGLIQPLEAHLTEEYEFSGAKTIWKDSTSSINTADAVAHSSSLMVDGSSNEQRAMSNEPFAEGKYKDTSSTQRPDQVSEGQWPKVIFLQEGDGIAVVNGLSHDPRPMTHMWCGTKFHLSST